MDKATAAAVVSAALLMAAAAAFVLEMGYMQGEVRYYEWDERLLQAHITDTLATLSWASLMAAILLSMAGGSGKDGNARLGLKTAATSSAHIRRRQQSPQRPAAM